MSRPIVAVAVTARPSYSRLRSLLEHLRGWADVHLVVVGSALLERYGNVASLIGDGYTTHKAWTVVEGETLETTARSTALAILDVGTILRNISPDAVVVHADRHEVLGVAIAARYQELPLVHLQGGEQTGSIDDRVRDAITQLADLHLVSTHMAALRVREVRPGAKVVTTGCPSIDIAAEATRLPPVTLADLGGDGADIDLSKRFLVVLQHPVSDHANLSHLEMLETLKAVKMTGLPAVVFWPGNEAGTDKSSKAIREMRHEFPIHTVRNLPPERFLKLLTQSACLVGNSSVGIRECSALGVRVVNIGDRQVNRAKWHNVLDAEPNRFKIEGAIRAQLAMSRPAKSTLYGDGTGGRKMSDAIKGWMGERWNS